MLDFMREDKLRQLEYRFGLQRVEIKDPGINAEVWAFRYRSEDTQLVSVCTVAEPQDYCITVLEPDLGAAAALLRTVLQREDGPWQPGRVWLNDQPLLTGTSIQGLVVTGGELSQVYPLTEPEALLVAEETLSAITITSARRPLAFCELFRDNAFHSISDAELADIKVFGSTHPAPLRQIKALPYGRFAAFTMEESEDFLADPDNVEATTALALLPRLHGSRLFFRDSQPGELLTYGHNGWEYSVT